MGKNKNGSNKKKNNSRKLSAREVEQAIEKIREGYDHYMVKYMKDHRARDAFEQRYLDALKARIDLDRFIAEELGWLKRLEEEAQQEGRQAEESRKKSKNEKNDFADRVLEELRARIEGYPNIGLEVDEVYEVDKLFGAVAQFEREYWPALDRIYRKLYPSRYTGPRVVLETRLFELSEPTSGRLPAQLHTLQSLLGRFPRNYKEIGREAKQCILAASFFLHTIKNELASLDEEAGLGEREKKTVEKALDFVHTVIEDFRLTDLKETSTEARR